MDIPTTDNRNQDNGFYFTQEKKARFYYEYY